MRISISPANSPPHADSSKGAIRCHDDEIEYHCVGGHREIEVADSITCSFEPSFVLAERAADSIVPGQAQQLRADRHPLATELSPALRGGQIVETEFDLGHGDLRDAYVVARDPGQALGHGGFSLTRRQCCRAGTSEIWCLIARSPLPDCPRHLVHHTGELGARRADRIQEARRPHRAVLESARSTASTISWLRVIPRAAARRSSASTSSSGSRTLVVCIAIQQA